MFICPTGKWGQNAENGNWYTHPAFSFGSSINKEENTQLTGIWVGKFENSGSVTALRIKPNVTSLSDTVVGAMFKKWI